MMMEKNLSNWSSDICCLCCPTIELCGISTGIKELMVGGLLANVEPRTDVGHIWDLVQRVRSRFKSDWKWDFWIFGHTDSFTSANATSQNSTSVAQGDLLQEYGRKFEVLPDDQKLSKLCSDAGFLKNIGTSQFFITSEEGSEVMQTACREHTHNLMIESLSRDQTVSSYCEWYQQIRHKKFLLRTFNCSQTEETCGKG